MASKRKKEHKTKKKKKDRKARKERKSKEARKARAAKPRVKPRSPQPAASAKAPTKGRASTKGGGTHETPKGRSLVDQPTKGDQRPQPSTSKKPARKSGGRRDGKGYAPGELLLPGGCQTTDEILYLFRGCVAAERPVADDGLTDILSRRGLAPHDPSAEDVLGAGIVWCEILYLFRGCVAAERPVADDGLTDILSRRGLAPHDPSAEDVRRHVAACVQRFASGGIEPMLPSRAQVRRTFAGFIERARGRRREIGAFLDHLLNAGHPLHEVLQTRLAV